MTESESQKRCAGLHSWFPKLFAFLWGSNPIMYRGFIILDLVANSQKLVKITTKENPPFQTGRCFPREEFPNFYCKSRHSNFLPQDLGLVASWKYVARHILTLVQWIEIFGLKIDFQLFKKTESAQSKVR